LNKYEGMFILTDTGKPEEQEGRLARVRGEIEKLGGKVENITRLGKRAFARRLHKQEGGVYAVINFLFDGKKFPALRARLALNEDILRQQFLRRDETAAGAAAVEEEAGHGEHQ
jgi:ribosomal protein S6